MKNTISTQIRLSEQMDTRIAEISEELGVSKNAAMLMLMGLGLKLYNAEIRVSPDLTGQ